MTTKYQRNFTDTFPFSDTCINILLEASTAIAWTVPGTVDQIYRTHFSVSTSADVWVRNDPNDGAAIVPLSNTIQTTTYQERIDVNFIKYVKGGDVLSFISTGISQVGVSLLQVQPIT